MTNLPDIAQRLRDCAEDPMWADHAEVPKVWLWEASAEIERFAARCYPSKVVLISNTGHYVSEPVFDEIERLRARVANLEATNSRRYALIVDAEAVIRLQREKLNAAVARIAELETKLTEEAAAWESAARIDAVIEGKGR